MNLILFFVILALCGFVFARVEPLLVMPAIAPLAMFKDSKNPFVGVLIAISWLWQVYILLAWCVLTVLLTQFFMSRSVDHRWIYYTVGLFGCLAPILFILSFDHEPETPRAIFQLATTLLTAVGFVAFVLHPRITYPWSWIVRWWAR